MDRRHRFHPKWLLRHSNISIILLIVTGLLLFLLGKGQILPQAGYLLCLAGVFWLTVKTRWFWQHPTLFLLLSIFFSWFGFRTEKHADSVMWHLLGSLLLYTSLFLLLPAIIWFGFVMTGVWKWIKKNYIDPQAAVKKRYWNPAERQRQNNSCTNESPALNGHRLHLEPRRNLPYICAFIPVFPAALFWSVVIVKATDIDADASRFINQTASGLAQMDFGQALTGGTGILLSLLWIIFQFIMLIFLAFASIILIISILIHIYSRWGMYRIEEDGGEQVE